MKGVKYDTGKPPIFRGVLGHFPRAIAAVAEVSALGAAKYDWEGWRSVPDGINRYSDALGRHFAAEGYEELDEELGCMHAKQVAWNALARLELMLIAKENICPTKKNKSETP